MDPHDIAQYYGIHGPEHHRPSNHTGAGQLNDEDMSDMEVDGNRDEGTDEEWEEFEQQMGIEYLNNFLPTTVKVPRHSTPFTAAQQDIFSQALAEVIASTVLPGGYGIQVEEWEDGENPSFEIIQSGRRGRKDLRVALPDNIWRPRAEIWVQGLHVMQQLTYMLEQ